MIEIVIPVDCPHKERMEKIPKPLINCVNYMSLNYPDFTNDTQERWFDRKFEQLNPGVRILYNPDRVVWLDDREYTMFALRWS
jgi:hypothetical protein